MRFTHPAIAFVGRLLIAYIYATSGYSKVFGWAGNVQYLTRHNFPVIPVLLVAAAIVEVGGTICLVTGYQARWAAFIMAVYTVIVTVTLHNYWAANAQMAGMQETEFRKNLAIAGGLLFVSFAGPGRWALGNKPATYAAHS
jgi:putative oxidoreductase